MGEKVIGCYASTTHESESYSMCMNACVCVLMDGRVVYSVNISLFVGDFDGFILLFFSALESGTHYFTSAHICLTNVLCHLGSGLYSLSEKNITDRTRKGRDPLAQ